MHSGCRMALSRGLRCCQRVFSWVPVVIISSVVLWSYYAYVWELCLVTVENALEKAIRFCDRCQVVKPDRCHHCSVCGMCVLKMDHHCPWVNNCIGFSNYKFFLLFLAYAMLYCAYIAATVFQYFLLYWTAELPNNRAKFHVLFLLFVSLMFFISLMFLFGYHCWLVGLNRTTLEAFSAPVFPSGPDKNGFHLGIRRNLEQVFGKRKKLWIIPVFTSIGDGLSFPMRMVSESHNPLLGGNQWDDEGTDDESPVSRESHVILEMDT
ncbi:hypothetical protein GDO81_003569 [Engystomops pustulosus]|uniref:Palmitoyltransferase n=1 Tax=Engystomops pustulosus TaxID=76066 RepID=A0AAV6ZXK8_ENGPU|nr:hypothetical protein GDO81_003569 [Engystomops pustulosus]